MGRGPPSREASADLRFAPRGVSEPEATRCVAVFCRDVGGLIVRGGGVAYRRVGSVG
jgi:hypothetical protein